MALYDPKEFPTETTVSPDFTLADVLAWARTKPADEAYNYTDIRGCAVCLFLKDTGRARKPIVGPFNWRDSALDTFIQHQLSGAIDNAADGQASKGPNTFGAFADRLEKALAQ